METKVMFCGNSKLHFILQLYYNVQNFSQTELFFITTHTTLLVSLQLNFSRGVFILNT